MYVSDKERLVWFRVPAAGSTSYLKVLQHRAPDLKAFSPDHDLFRDQFERGAWGHDGYDIIVNIRDPWKWVMSMYAMCHRSSAHWGEYVGTSHGKKKNDIEYFLENVVTPLDWVTHPTTGKVIATEVACVEKAYTEFGHLNMTTMGAKRKFEMTTPLASIFRKRFHRELAYYK